MITQRKDVNRPKSASRHINSKFGRLITRRKLKEFQIGDLVLRRVIQSTRQKDHGKLGPNWEGPYIIIAHGGNRSYTLVDQGASQLNKQLNSFHLKRYYM